MSIRHIRNSIFQKGIGNSRGLTNTLSDQEKSIFKLYIKNAKSLYYEHIGTIDRLGMWKQINNETAKLVALVSMNDRVKQIVVSMYETPWTTYEKDKLLFVEQSLYQMASKKFYLTYQAFKLWQWNLCSKIDEDNLDKLIKECEEEGGK